MQDACFQGTAHIADPGSTVTVTNRGQMPHDFAAADGSFASGLLQPGQSFELTVDEPGVIPFYCTLHGSATGSGMAGVLFVGDVASPAGASPMTTPAAAVQSRLATAVADERAANASPAATATASHSVAMRLAAAALLMSSVALVAAFARVRSPRREPGATSQA